MHHRHGDRALTDGGGDALDVVGANVAGGEDARHARLEGVRATLERPSGAIDVAAGAHETVVIALDGGGQPIRSGLGPDQHEQRRGIESGS